MTHQQFQNEVETRFLRYVQIDTQADVFSQTNPSTAKQFDLLKMLRDELSELGASDVELTEGGYIFATIPATAGYESTPVVALLAHVDTAPSFSGTGVKPIVHRNYQGGEIVLPDDDEMRLTDENSPQLKHKIGEDIVTASGTTLLGADDKAGVAILMTLANNLLNGEPLTHGAIRICFTPDEEIGRSVMHLKLDDVKANVAYTLDGGKLGAVDYETFSADGAVVNIKGVSIHPGYAKGRMVNALQLAAKFAASMPTEYETPATTSGREGFIHLSQINGNESEAEIRLIIRDFEMDGLEAKGDFIRGQAAALREVEPRAEISCEISAQYRNMRYWLEKDMTPVDLAAEATRRIGVEPVSEPTRGGTDGSGLTQRGLPTPNLFTGMQNFHGPLEWVSVQDMAKSTAMCRELVQLWASDGQDYVGWRG